MNLPISSSPNLSSYKVHGMDIVVETPKYGVRTGPGWMNVSPADYGYIRGYIGADGDEMDCYVGPNPLSQNVYVVDQNRIDDFGKFDEHKCMLGYNSLNEAKSDYLAGHTHGNQILRGISKMSLPVFKRWLEIGNLTKPLHDQTF